MTKKTLTMRALADVELAGHFLHLDDAFQASFYQEKYKKRGKRTRTARWRTMCKTTQTQSMEIAGEEMIMC